jgi:hypothetical protein
MLKFNKISSKTSKKANFRKKKKCSKIDTVGP